MGRSFFILKKYDRAIEAFDAVLVLKPDSGEILFEKGLSYSHLDQPESALEAFNACIGMVWITPVYMQKRDWCSPGSTEIEDAIASFDRALELIQLTLLPSCQG